MNKSETIATLAKALSGFQAEMTAVPKESSNPFYKSKYAELSTIIGHSHKLLGKHGLSVSQMCNAVDDLVSVTTLLMHTSGEWLSGTIAMKPAKNDPQGYGSAITYARRYSLSAILGLATEEDDDGNAASNKTEDKKPKAQNAPVVGTKASEGNPAESESKALLAKAIRAIEKAKTGAELDKIETSASKYQQEGRLTSIDYDKIGVALTEKMFELNPKGN